MKITSTFFFLVFCLQVNAFDFDKLGVVVDAQLLWKVSSFNDLGRLYSFRSSPDGIKRDLNSLESIGIGYTHVTAGGVLLIPSVKLGRYGTEGAWSNCLGLGFTLAKYHFQDYARYIDISIQRDFTNSLGTSACVNMGVVCKIWEKPGVEVNQMRMGIGLSAIRLKGITAAGIQLKFHWWQFGFMLP